MMYGYGYGKLREKIFIKAAVIIQCNFIFCLFVDSPKLVHVLPASESVKGSSGKLCVTYKEGSTNQVKKV